MTNNLRWNRKKTTANVRYFRKGAAVQNFGDYLAEYLLARLFYGPPIVDRRIYLIGSVISDSFIKMPLLSRLTSQTFITKLSGKVAFWGCGLRSEDQLSSGYKKLAAFLAVRGPLSRKALGLPDAVPIGDPALLLPAIYRPRPARAYVGKTLCIPHFHDVRTDAEVSALSGCAALIRTNIRPELEAIEEIIDAITSADFVLTASLHGAIVAGAYGKKFAFWGSGTDLPFKWRDFAESVSIPVRFVNRAEDGIVHYDNVLRPKLSMPPLWPLLAVAPFAVRPDILARVIKLDLERCGKGILATPVDTSTIEQLAYEGATSRGFIGRLCSRRYRRKGHSFYSKSVATRRALTRKAISEKGTLLERWQTVNEENTKDWSERARVVASLITEENSIADLGCGPMHLERALSHGVRYIPLDVIRRDSRTIVVDLNREDLPKVDAECLVAIGLLEYIHDVSKLLSSIAVSFKTAVISYNILERTPSAEERESNGWVNSLTAANLETEFAKAGLIISEKQSYQRQLIWKLQTVH